jgi:hypothetical protein
MNASDCHWILEFTFDPLAACVRIVLTANPDNSTKDCEITVPQIVKFYTERYHDADDTCLGDFSGFTITQQGRHWRYELDTGDAKVTFESLQKVTL